MVIQNYEFVEPTQNKMTPEKQADRQTERQTGRQAGRHLVMLTKNGMTFSE